MFVSLLARWVDQDIETLKEAAPLEALVEVCWQPWYQLWWYSAITRDVDLTDLVSCKTRSALFQEMHLTTCKVNVSWRNNDITINVERHCSKVNVSSQFLAGIRFSWKMFQNLRIPSLPSCLDHPPEHCTLHMLESSRIKDNYTISSGSGSGFRFLFKFFLYSFCFSSSSFSSIIRWSKS